MDQRKTRKRKTINITLFAAVGAHVFIARAWTLFWTGINDFICESILLGGVKKYKR